MRLYDWAAWLVDRRGGLFRSVRNLQGTHRMEGTRYSFRGFAGKNSFYHGDQLVPIHSPLKDLDTQLVMIRVGMISLKARPLDMLGSKVVPPISHLQGTTHKHTASSSGGYKNMVSDWAASILGSTTEFVY